MKEMVKVTLKGKKGKEFEALVPIATACKVLFIGEDTSNICRMSYSVVHKCRNFLLDRAGISADGFEDSKTKLFLALLDHAPAPEIILTPGISADEFGDSKTKLFFAVMNQAPKTILANGVELYRD